MFLSVRQPAIPDARTLAAISKARNENGVHIYFNEPHTKANNEFNTPLTDMARTKSTYLTWTSMFRAKGDQPVFGLAMRVDGDRAALEYGITATTYQYYASRKENSSWNSGQKNYSVASLKKGDYVVLTLHIQYPQVEGKIVEPIKAEVNGVEQTTPVTFTKAENFSNLGSSIRQHTQQFNNVELLETHFLYTGITRGLPPHPRTDDYISLKDLALAYITQFDTVIIQGQYATLNRKYRGILVGLSAAGKSEEYTELQSYLFDSSTVTIRLTVGFYDVAVSTDKERQVLNIAIGPDDNAWLLVDNINISNLEIHTTAKIEK